MTYEGEEPIEVNGKKVVAFKESGEWTIPEGVTNVDVLVIAGGGGGGGVIGGGGGAGGLVFREDFDISGESSPISITIGTGGEGGTGWNTSTQNGKPGTNSNFSTLEALGGGGGRHYGGNTSSTVVNGGSGGGGANGGSGGGTGLQPSHTTTGLGNNGGNGGDNNRGAGGGGSSAVGGNTVSQGGGNGGAGSDYSTQFGTTYGVSGLFAGGGGGGLRSDQSGSAGTGGSGGGGDGTKTSIKAENGVANTGSGGGGAGYDTSNSNVLGGNGGSGIVIIAYEEILPFTIKGKVTLNSTNVEGAKVRLINDTTNEYVGDTLTDASGDYEFEVGSDTDDFHAMVEYESGGNKYHAVSYPFIKGGEDE